MSEVYKCAMRVQRYDYEHENMLYFGNLFSHATATDDEYIRTINLSPDIRKLQY